METLLVRGSGWSTQGGLWWREREGDEGEREGREEGREGGRRERERWREGGMEGDMIIIKVNQDVVKAKKGGGGNFKLLTHRNPGLFSSVLVPLPLSQCRPHTARSLHPSLVPIYMKRRRNACQEREGGREGREGLREEGEREGGREGREGEGGREGRREEGGESERG